jgi:hypothetical protein
MVGIYAVNLKSRHLLWGGNGLLPFETYRQAASGYEGALSLYRYSGAEWYTESLYWLGMITALAFALGLYPRVLCWVFAVLTYTTIDRLHLAFDAGGDLARILAIYLCFMDSGRYLVAFRAPRTSFARPAANLGTLTHNAARFVLAFQVCMVYFWASYYKLSGSMWRDGTALHYVMELERYRIVPALSHALSNDHVAAAATLGTLAFQTAFPYLMWFKSVKPLLIFVGVALHIGIAVSMGLVSFSATMIVADLSLLSKTDWSAARASILRFKDLGLGRWRTREASEFSRNYVELRPPANVPAQRR